MPFALTQLFVLRLQVLTESCMKQAGRWGGGVASKDNSLYMFPVRVEFGKSAEGGARMMKLSRRPFSRVSFGTCLQRNPRGNQMPRTRLQEAQFDMFKAPGGSLPFPRPVPVSFRWTDSGRDLCRTDSTRCPTTVAEMAGGHSAATSTHHRRELFGWRGLGRGLRAMV